jgi:carboxymethylenebutenolidase
MNGLDFKKALEVDIRGAVEHLTTSTSKIAVCGFCMGGALAVAAAARVPGLAAAVCFYGIPARDVADPIAITIPLQGHFASRDTWCTPEAARKLRDTMTAAGHAPEIYFYEANHGFFNEELPEHYDAACAETAWTKTVSFLRRRLG